MSFDPEKKKKVTECSEKAVGNKHRLMSNELQSPEWQCGCSDGSPEGPVMVVSCRAYRILGGEGGEGGGGEVESTWYMVDDGGGVDATILGKVN